MLGRWNEIKAKIPVTRRRPDCRCRASRCRKSTSQARSRVTFSAKVCRANFRILNAAYREMYLEPIREIESLWQERMARMARKQPRARRLPTAEEPTRLFSGLMLAEDTNKRFHFLTRHQRIASAQHRIRWADTLWHRQRCRRRFRKNRRGRRGHRHSRRHGAAL